jgi:hypothetical protein
MQVKGSSPRHNQTASRDSISRDELITAPIAPGVSTEAIKPRRHSTSSIASLLKIDLSPLPLANLQDTAINSQSSNAEAKTTYSHNPLPNSIISPEQKTEGKSSFDQNDKTDIMSTPSRRRSI